MPARLIGARVRVALSASELAVFDGARRVATHPRLITRGECRLELDHYLEILLGKPGALPGSTALAQARAAGRFTADPRGVLGRRPQPARRRRRHPGVDRGAAAAPPAARDAVLAGIRAALAAGSVSADVVAIEARKHTATGGTGTGTATDARRPTADGAAAVPGRGGDPGRAAPGRACPPMPGRRRRCATTTSC